MTSLVILLAVVGFVEPNISLQGDFGEPQCIVAAPQDPRFAHLSWPKIVKTNDGRWVVAYVAGRFHGTHGEGCPAVSISRDDGKTFSPPNVLKEYGPNDPYTSGGNVALGLADDGAVVLLSMAYKGNEANTIDGWRLMAGSEQWKAADTSRIGLNKTGSVYGHIFPVTERKLAVVGHYRRGSQNETAGLWMSYSTDAGQSWGDPKTISKLGLVEPAFVFTKNRFVGLVRPNRTPAWYTQFTSDDLGQTWQVEPKVLAAAEPKGVIYPSPGLFVDPDQPDRLYALVSQRFSAEAKNGLYGQIDLHTADMSKLEWTRVGTLARFPRTLGERKDLTYGWMAPGGKGQWYLVFYCGKMHGANDIYGLKFELPDPPAP